MLRSGHLQTMIGNYFGAETPRHGLVQHHVPTPDGDQLVLHDDAPNAPQTQRIALLVHGLGGSHTSGYTQRLSSKLLARGIHPIRMDQRGCGTGALLAVHMAHADRAADITCCLDWINSRFNQAPITICGFSLGASIVLKALATKPLPSNLDSAIAVSPPLDLANCCSRIPRFYDRYYSRRLWKHWLSCRSRLKGAQGLSVPRRTTTILEFDRWITAPLNGYASVETYYTAASPGRDLPKISTPSLILIAEDDPIVPADAYDNATLSPVTSVVRSASGGHLGFMSRSVGHPKESDRRWMEWRVVDWIAALPQLKNSSPSTMRSEDRENAHKEGEWETS